MNDLYQELLLEEARYPQNQGIIENADLTLTEHNASCGDQVTIYLKLGPQKTIADVKWSGEGCVISQAAMSVLSSLVKGKTVEQVAAISQAELETLLGIENISVGRIKCLLLGTNAFKKATL